MQHAAVAKPILARGLFPSNPTVFLCLVGLVLPNALSLGALAAGIGAPPRPAAIMAYATLAIVARIAHPLPVVVLYLAAAAYDAISTLALLFNLAPTEIGLALHLSAELKLTESPFYVALTAALAAVVAANIAVLTLKRDLLRRGNVIVLMVGAVLFAATDFLANTSAHYQFGTLYAAGKPMETAARASGFRQAIAEGAPRRALLVHVEALGLFAKPSHQALLMQPFANPELRRRYDVKAGSTTYYGSTTAAEMRELCDTREPYQALLDGRDLDCLPGQLTNRGYRTVAMHNFTSAFFARDRWYPRLGFQTAIFGQDLAARGGRLCGGPFKGPCDADLVPMIAQQLREAKQPIFFYWMTLSTHVPIAPGEGTPRLRCERGGGALGHAEVCYMTEMWLDLFDAIARLAIELPGSEILVVGDHAPPLWSKAGRRLFTPGQVTWVRLVPKAGGGN